MGDDDRTEATNPGFAPTSAPSMAAVGPPNGNGSWNLSKVQTIVGLAVTLGGLFSGLVLTYHQVHATAAKVEQLALRQASMERKLLIVCTKVVGDVEACQIADAMSR